MASLIPLLLQNVALLAFAVVFTPLILDYNKSLHGIRRRLVLGVLFGLACLLVTAFPVISPEGAALDARAGPIIFAGFLYGPAAGIVAAGIGSIGRIATGGPFILSGIIIFYVYAAVGVLIARLRHRQVEITAIRRLDIVLLCAASIIGAANMYWLISPNERANEWLVEGLPLIALINSLSIVVLGVMLHVVFRVVRDRDRASRLAERLELATTAAGIGIFDFDIAGNRVMWDSQEHRLHGLEPGTFAGTYEAWQAAVHPDDKASAIAAADDAIKGIAPFDTEFRIVTPAGEERIIKGAATVLRDKAGRPERMVGVNFDLTSLRQSEREAARRQERLDDIAATIPGVLQNYRIQADGAHEIDFISDGCREMFEFDPEDLNGNPQPLWDVIKPECKDSLAEAVQASARTLTPMFHAWQIVTPSGKIKWLEGRGVPRRREDGSTEWSTLLIDVTERHRMNEELARSQKLNAELKKFEAIGKLTGGVAHDFNNLLAVVLGNLELNLQEELSPAARAGLEDAIAACKRGATLTGQLLAFGRRAILRPEPVDLNAALTQIAALMARTFRENITIDVKQTGGLWTTRLDRAAIDGAVLNAAFNARDAMPDGGTLTLETANVELSQTSIAEHGDTLTPGRYVMVAITDTGCGIAEADLPHVYEPFYTTKRVGEGSGMGLSMLHGFVNQSKGLVRIHSEKDVGTTLSMYFPATREAAQEPTVERLPGRMPRGSERILLVEDEELVRRTLARQLVTIGYDVVTAENGGAAMAIVEAGQAFDLLITDVVMPGPLQGPALAERIRAHHDGIPVIFISGYPAEAAIGNGLTSGDLQLMKPISLDDLARAIRRIFDTDAVEEETV